MDSTEFFGGEQQPPGLEDDKDGYGRYLLDADGKGKAPYTRATTIAKMLDSGKGLEIWQQRKVAKGVAQSPALVARAAVTPLEDKQAWREILDQAEVKSGGDEKRDLGSAFHALHEHVETMSDSEWAAVPPDLKATYVKYRAELKRLGITEVMTEVTLVNTKIGTAGKADAIFRLADGRLVIGDRKSGRITEYPHSAAVQFAIYANADVLLTWNEDGSVERHPMPELDLTTAIVIDVKIGDENTASVHAYEVDIWAGWAAALLSAKIRRWRNRRDLLTPYHPEFPPSDKARNAATVEITQHPEAWAKAPTKLVPGTGVPPGYVAGYADVRETGDGPAPFSNETAAQVNATAYGTDVPRATPEQRAAFAAELPPPSTGFPTEVAHGPAANVGAGMSPTAQAVAGIGPAIGTGDAIQPPHAGTHPAWSSKDQAVVQLDNKGERADVTVGEPHAQLTAPGTADVDALLAAFKTKAQLQTAAKSVGLTQLNRTRANLAKDMVSHPNWPTQRAALLGKTDVAMGIIAEGDQHEQDGTGPAAASDEDGPTSREEFSATVSNAPGPVPPDPEPSYPAPAADNPFAQPAAAAPAPTLSVEDQVLQLIGEASTLDDLAAAWQTANDAGIGWPPRLHKAATIRQNQLTQ
jgi:hypothetical protein